MSSKRYSMDENQTILNDYKDKILESTITEWNEFAKEQNLPRGQTFMREYNVKWNELKQMLSGGEYEVKHHRSVYAYSKEQIKEIISNHSEAFTNQKDWNAYAAEHQLPNYAIIKKHLTNEEINEAVGFLPAYTRDYLATVAREHEEAFTTKRSWHEYASKHKLPSPHSYIRAYGSWKKAKETLFEE